MRWRYLSIKHMLFLFAAGLLSLLSYWKVEAYRQSELIENLENHNGRVYVVGFDPRCDFVRSMLRFRVREFLWGKYYGEEIGIRFFGHDVTAEDIEGFLRIGYVTELDASGSNVGTSELRYLIGNSNLLKLSLLATNVSENVVVEVATGMPQLRLLDLRKTKVSEEALNRIQTLRPGLIIWQGDDMREFRNFRVFNPAYSQ